MLTVFTLASFPEVFLGLKRFIYRDFGYFKLSVSFLFSRMLLERRTATLEPAEQLRHSIPGAVEHFGVPLVTIGQKPEFLDSQNTLLSLMLPNFNPRDIVYL